MKYNISGAIIYYTRKNKDDSEKYKPVPTNNPSRPTDTQYISKEEGPSGSEETVKALEPTAPPPPAPPVTPTTSIPHQVQVPLYVNMVQSSGSQPVLNMVQSSDSQQVLNMVQSSFQPLTQYAIPPFQIIPVVASPVVTHSHIIQVSNHTNLSTASEYSKLTTVTESGGREHNCNSTARVMWGNTARSVLEQHKEHPTGEEETSTGQDTEDSSPGEEEHIYQSLETENSGPCTNGYSASIGTARPRSERFNSDPSRLTGVAEEGLQSAIKFRSEPNLLE